MQTNATMSDFVQNSQLLSGLKKDEDKASFLAREVFWKFL